MTSRSIVAAGVLAMVIAPGSALAAVPVGYLDSASCDAIQGWSQDPDEPDKAIDVHIYFGGPAGTPGVPAAATPANVYRADLCGAIGSCAHGFVAAPPLSLLNGQPHDIYAYGIDSMGGTNPVLGSSPRVLSCPPTASGVRRKISLPAFEAWGFSSFWDLLPLGGAEADALAGAPDLPAAPMLVKADDGDTIWLVDGGVRRQVPVTVAPSWRFDLATVEERPAAEVQALTEGTPLRPRPVLFTHGALYLVDDAQPAGQAGGGGGGSVGQSSSTSVGSGGSGGSGVGGGSEGGGGGSAAGEPADAASGCGVSGARSDRGLDAWLIAAIALLARTLRRRDR